MNTSTRLESAERAVARLEAASAEHPLEFLDDLAWALLYLGNERHRLGDLEGAVDADERAVARVRTLAELGGTGVNQTPSQGGQDIVYLLSSLSCRYLAAGRARDAQLAALEGYEWQAGQVGATPRAAGDVLETLATLALDVFEASDALGEADTAIEALMDAMLLQACASAYVPRRSARLLDEMVREAWRVVG